MSNILPGCPRTETPPNYISQTQLRSQACATMLIY
jgi:hypothetical protein